MKHFLSEKACNMLREYKVAKGILDPECIIYPTLNVYLGQDLITTISKDDPDLQKVIENLESDAFTKIKEITNERFYYNNLFNH